MQKDLSIQRAIISVSNKSGLLNLAQNLKKYNVEILSSGGTARFLQENDIEVIEIANYTKSPELFDGRVKTLHPKIHGGILYRREDKSHCQQAEENNIDSIDLVVVNLYPFEQCIAKAKTSFSEAIEQIDIGGPAMMRAAAKNMESVAILSQPSSYSLFIEEFEKQGGKLSAETRKKLAKQAFQHTSDYDKAIARYLGKEKEKSFEAQFSQHYSLRYGDNPHQKASFFTRTNPSFKQIQGKELSYTNLLDIEAGIRTVSEFTETTLAILKHTNPCGIGQDENLISAWQKAFATDVQAPFGGVLVSNKEIEKNFAQVLSEVFLDIIITPHFSKESLAILGAKKNVRLIEISNFTTAIDSKTFRSLLGGVAVMDLDKKARGLDNLKIPTQRKPSKDEMKAISFAWKVVKNVKSNAIVIASHDRTLGIGAGQMSRIDSCRLAVQKAKNAKLNLQGASVASDAFFPFPDGLEILIDAGITACVQPGGSIRDKEVIQVADKANMAMVFTGNRHFLH